MHSLQLRPNAPPPTRRKRGHVCVEKRRHLCYKYAKTATLPQMRDASSLPYAVSAPWQSTPPIPLLPELLASSKILKNWRISFGGKAVKEKDTCRH
jgi:hypothetical protein